MKFVGVVSVLVVLLGLAFFIFSSEEQQTVEEGVGDIVGEVSYGTVVQVFDGDTVSVDLPEKTEIVRYIGIDTPEGMRNDEPAECYSREATDRNRALVLGKEVKMVTDINDRDQYNRLLRYVFVDDVLINEVLVEEGYATALTISPDTQRAERFAELEEQAEQRSRGLWGSCR